MALIGITGGIGSGKSAALACFAALGCATWDADAAVHELYRPGAPGHTLVRQRWGAGAFTAEGTLDRAFVARQVFARPAERRWLEEQMHPLVRSHLGEAAAAVRPAPLWCAVPLLYETGWHAAFTAVIAVWCADALRRGRLQARGWTTDQIAGRDAAQWSQDDKLRRADYGIANHGSPGLLAEQCRRVHAHVVHALAQRRSPRETEGKTQHG